MYVGIIDYGIGNLRSVTNAIGYLGAVPQVSSDPSVLDECDRIILPGVGAFPHGMQKLAQAGLADFVRRYAASGRPCLGICLGMQLLHEWGTEFAHTAGLGLLSGSVDHLRTYSASPDTVYRMPNVGWRPLVRVQNQSELADRMLAALGPDNAVYFIHSFGVAPDCVHAAALSDFADLRFAAMVARDNLVGTQFHPEKSREAGLSMLKAFIF